MYTQNHGGCHFFFKATFDFDFEDHGFHHFFFLGVANSKSSAVGVIGVMAAIVPALFRRLLRTRRGGGPSSLGSSAGVTYRGNLREECEQCTSMNRSQLLTLQRRPGN